LLDRPLAALVLASFPTLIGGSIGSAQDPSAPAFQYRPKLRTSDTLEPFLRHLAPGEDSFPEEKEAEALRARLEEWGAKLRQDPRRGSATLVSLLAPEFKGGRLSAAEEATIVDRPALQVFRGKTIGSEPQKDTRAFGVEVEPCCRTWTRSTWPSSRSPRSSSTGTRDSPARRCATTSSAAVGTAGAPKAWVAGACAGGGTRAAAGACWSGRRRSSREAALRPRFSRGHQTALGGNDSFRRQLTVGFDDWVATIDAGLTRDSNGPPRRLGRDADGDGLDDIYVSQPRACRTASSETVVMAPSRT
jgi:hypothetical protein